MKRFSSLYFLFTFDFKIVIMRHSNCGLFHTELQCDVLDPPVNGLMGCTDWTQGKICIMSCNDQYDLPRTANSNGQFSCSLVTGLWTPPDVFGCTGIATNNFIQQIILYIQYKTGRLESL